MKFQSIKYIEILSDIRRDIDNLMNEFPEKVLICRTDLCERENKILK